MTRAGNISQKLTVGTNHGHADVIIIQMRTTTVLGVNFKYCSLLKNARIHENFICYRLFLSTYCYCFLPTSFCSIIKMGFNFKRL